MAILLFFSGTSAWAIDFFAVRDHNTGIFSNSQRVISYRHMRHLWNTSDGVMAVALQKKGYDGENLVLYKSLDQGVNWTLDTLIDDDGYLISDGIIDSENNLLFVTSIPSDKTTRNIEFIKLVYDSTFQEWEIDPATPVTVFRSNRRYKASRASIAVDSNGVIWCAYRINYAIDEIFQIIVMYSVDGGMTWVDSGNEFGTPNGLPEKSAKVIAVDNGIAMIYQDQMETPVVERYKEWAYREDNQPLQDSWITGSIAKMNALDRDPYGTHWSVAADDLGNLHLAYEDSGINYTKFDLHSMTWTTPEVVAAFGSYSSISVGANQDLFLFSKYFRNRMAVRQFSYADQQWGRWITLSSKSYLGLLRMSSPERFDGLLPLLFQVNNAEPYELIYNLIDTR